VAVQSIQNGDQNFSKFLTSGSKLSIERLRKSALLVHARNVAARYRLPATLELAIIRSSPIRGKVPGGSTMLSDPRNASLRGTMRSAGRHYFAFGPYHLDPVKRLLLRAREPVHGELQKLAQSGGSNALIASPECATSSSYSFI
jgi:hypothetical protein